MPNAPILCLGARWYGADVYWNTSPDNAILAGVPRQNVTAPAVNFAHQSGIYILYSDDRPMYVGQANKTLFARLKHHWLIDDLAGRWNCFTWFGMRRVIGGKNPRLSDAEPKFNIEKSQLLDHFEAAMIHAFEPPMNGQEGRFGKQVWRYKQVRDSRLGPTDRLLMEGIATTGGFVPDGKIITKTGWKDSI